MIRSAIILKKAISFLWDDGIEGPTYEQSIYLSCSGAERRRRWRSAVLRSSNSWSIMPSIPSNRIANYVLKAKTGRQTQCCLQIGAQLSRFRFSFVSFVYFSIYRFVNQPTFFVNMIRPLFLDDHFPGFMSFTMSFTKAGTCSFTDLMPFQMPEVIAGERVSSWPSFMAILPLISYFDPPCASRWFQSIGILRESLCLWFSYAFSF